MAGLKAMFVWWQSLPLPWRSWRVVGRVAAGDDVADRLPYRGVVLVGARNRETWAVFDCPCRMQHRPMVNLDSTRFPFWRIESRKPLSIRPSIDAAEKLMGMLRRHVGDGSLRIIVPDFAKSAGTVMVLGADRVVMSDTSELGPIDPQAPLFDRWQSVQNYLDAYDDHATTLKTDPGDVAAKTMLDKLDPATLKLCRAAVSRARQAAETLLKQGMFRHGGNWSLTVSELLDTTRWLSHGQMISWEDAQDPQLGLLVEHHPYCSVEWQGYWRLHCLQRLAIGDRQKLYESAHASLIIGPAG